MTRRTLNHMWALTAMILLMLGVSMMETAPNDTSLMGCGGGGSAGEGAPDNRTGSGTR